jgi:hypothetical protein
VFGACLAAALPMYLVFGRHNWFFLDEWDFLANRSLTSVHDLLRPHTQHWSTLPIILYRVQYQVFGLRTYVPYLLATVVLHLAAALLLRVVMRRAGVRPWLATAGAAGFLFLGAGSQNIVWGFQVGFTGAVVGGLGQLILSDHEGGFDRRDGFALACGAAALMCSSVALPFVGAVGLAVLVRRGWRMALVHTVPLAALFVAWYAGFGHSAFDTPLASSGRIWHYAAFGLVNVIRKIGYIDPVAALLGAVLVVGGALAIAGGRSSLRSSMLAWALLGGSIAFAVLTGLGRAAIGTDASHASRYVHVLGAMLAPAFAVGAEQICRRWQFAFVPLALLLVAGVPGNISVASDPARYGGTIFRGNPQFVESLAVSGTAAHVPQTLQPDRFLMTGVTIGWLRRARREGKLPDPDRVDRRTEALVHLRLALAQVGRADTRRTCRTVHGPQDVRLRRNDVIRFSGPRLPVQLLASGKPAPPTTFLRSAGDTLVVAVAGAHLRFVPQPGSRLRICT